MIATTPIERILYNGRSVKIAPPYGYDEVVPLAKDHRVLLPGGGTPSFCHALNAIALSFAEFPVAARDYPIVFASSDGGATFAPVIVLGLADRVNLFVDAAGQWDPAAYVPAYVRRYPFCISKVYRDGKPSGERLVCVARAYVDPGGIALFDAKGGASPQWRRIERLLAEYEQDLDRTAEMCAALARLALFAPFTMDVLEGNRKTTRLGGMYRVDEARLADQKPAAHKALVAKGFMGRIYAHVHSLENFARLYARERSAAARAAAAAKR
jgi:hypothetical protein